MISQQEFAKQPKEVNQIIGCTCNLRDYDIWDIVEHKPGCGYYGLANEIDQALSASAQKESLPVEVKYRNKPVVVSTILVRDALRCASSDWPGLPKWLLVAYEEGKVVFGVGWVSISTAEGLMRGDLDDILIQGVKGEIYPCKPDIFAATYEPAEPVFVEPEATKDVRPKPKIAVVGRRYQFRGWCERHPEKVGRMIGSEYENAVCVCSSEDLDRVRGLEISDVVIIGGDLPVGIGEVIDELLVINRVTKNRARTHDETDQA